MPQAKFSLAAKLTKLIPILLGASPLLLEEIVYYNQHMAVDVTESCAKITKLGIMRRIKQVSR